MVRYRPHWFAFLFGGNYRYGWRPSLYRHVRRFYREEWWRNGYTLKDWVCGSSPKYWRKGGRGYVVKLSATDKRL